MILLSPPPGFLQKVIVAVCFTVITPPRGKGMTEARIKTAQVSGQ